MKKAVLLLAVMMLVLGVSGQAMAYFSAGDLIEVIYKNGGTGNEILTDLTNSSISSWTTTSSSLPTATYSTGITATQLSTLIPGATWSNVNVAYFTYSGNGSAGNFWLSGPQSGQTNFSSQKSATKTNISGVMSTAALSTATNQLSQDMGTANSYWQNLNSNGTHVGTFGTFVNSGNGEASLAALGSGGHVDLWLYYYPSATSNLAGSGVPVAKLTVDNTGTVTAAPAGSGGPVTPIPAPIVLLGSGLLGLIGMRRKQAV